jgi:hypothetical protein
MIADIIPKIAFESNLEKESYAFKPRPSSAGPERCLRSMVYHAMGIEKAPLPGRAVIVFSDSTFHEELTADWIRQSAYNLHSEQMHVNCQIGLRDKPESICTTMINGHPCKEPIPAEHEAGHIDGIVTDLLGKDYLYEHKAINHFTFNNYWSGKAKPLDYLTQTAIYIRAVHELNPDILDGILLIKNKNTSQYMDYIVKYDFDNDILRVVSKTHSNGKFEQLDFYIEDVVFGARDRFENVYYYLNRNEIPERQYDIIDDWQCEYCEYGAHCYENYEHEITEYEKDIALPIEVQIMAMEYIQAGAEKRDAENRHNRLKTKIKKEMKNAGIQKGLVSDYVFQLSFSEKKYIDKDLIPAPIREKATKTKPSESLRIKQIN